MQTSILVTNVACPPGISAHWCVNTLIKRLLNGHVGLNTTGEPLNCRHTGLLNIVGSQYLLFAETV